MVTLKRKPDTSPYHHGGLSEAFLDAVEEQLPSKGPEGVSLRAAAKTAGVSSAAAFRHFRDKSAVMTAIAVRAHQGMAEAMEMASRQAHKDSDTMPFGAVGRAYLEFALSEPARFQIMFRAHLLDTEDPDLQAAEARLTKLLLSGEPRETGLDDQSESVQPPTEIPPTSLLAWGAVHGLATLAIEGALPSGSKKGQYEQIVAALAYLRLGS